MGNTRRTAGWSSNLQTVAACSRWVIRWSKQPDDHQRNQNKNNTGGTPSGGHPILELDPRCALVSSECHPGNGSNYDENR